MVAVLGLVGGQPAATALLPVSMQRIMLAGDA